eukprot:CAMPEP_0185282740 /NCGR_PEP_ID=MMETSP1359-20130426/67435_1 /TAXON_ID=552665 /ORGANISM="Bigelowiella longifila, Strain CCMP242" /LENGTH=73 /DNA_ID=CAMNT_0027878317 /DNA_START=789 /DNA_END=1010 /DNA_ORIENTATION=-
MINLNNPLMETTTTSTLILNMIGFKCAAKFGTFSSFSSSPLPQRTIYSGKSIWNPDHEMAAKKNRFLQAVSTV